MKRYIGNKRKDNPKLGVCVYIAEDFPDYHKYLNEGLIFYCNKTIYTTYLLILCNKQWL